MSNIHGCTLCHIVMLVEVLMLGVFRCFGCFRQTFETINEDHMSA